MSQRCFSVSTVASAEYRPDPQAALRELRGNINLADRQLLESIASLSNNGDTQRLTRLFSGRFRQLFETCPAEVVEQEAQSLLEAMRGIFPSSVHDSSVEALAACFSHRAQVRQYKNSTRDRAREQELRARWREIAEELRLDPDRGEQLYNVILETSVRMQEMQVSSVSAL